MTGWDVIVQFAPNSSLPGPYYYYWPGNPVIKPFGVAELLIIAASPRLDSRLRRE
ncbi:hypothetical protein [Candidatus Spongiihabitans sp.]|uniref:hypothetical protein n=1 Tax=Candidatus Spongiihabitans sp. TaxID=3101308 RepID=UPI003C7BBA8B